MKRGKWVVRSLAIYAVVQFVAIVVYAIAQGPAVPPGPGAPASSLTLPDWVGKYAQGQQQAAQACQIQLAQEQTKVEQLTKDLAEAKAAAAKAPEPKKP